MTAVSVPTAAQVADRLGYTESEVADAWAAEVADQDARCRTATYSAALAESLYRRVLRNMNMRNLPLGIQADQMGATRLSSVDPEVRRLEAPYRRLVVG